MIFLWTHKNITTEIDAAATQVLSMFQCFDVDYDSVWSIDDDDNWLLYYTEVMFCCYIVSDDCFVDPSTNSTQAAQAAVVVAAKL